MARFEGSTTLLPEPFDVQKEAVDIAAPAARAAAERIKKGVKSRMDAIKIPQMSGAQDGDLLTEGKTSE